MADVTLKVLRFLMLHQDLLVVEFAIAVVTPHLGGNPLLLLPHDSDSDHSIIEFVAKVAARGLCPAMAGKRKKKLGHGFTSLNFQLRPGLKMEAHIRNNQNQCERVFSGPMASRPKVILFIHHLFLFHPILLCVPSY